MAGGDGFVSPEHRERRWAAHERAARAHEHAARVHENAAWFYDSHYLPEKAANERTHAEADRAQAIAEHKQARRDASPDFPPTR